MARQRKRQVVVGAYSVVVDKTVCRILGPHGFEHTSHSWLYTLHALAAALELVETRNEDVRKLREENRLFHKALERKKEQAAP